MTQRYVGKHVILMARLREVQEAVAAALTQTVKRVQRRNPDIDSWISATEDKADALA